MHNNVQWNQIIELFIIPHNFCMYIFRSQQNMLSKQWHFQSKFIAKALIHLLKHVKMALHFLFNTTSSAYWHQHEFITGKAKKKDSLVADNSPNLETIVPSICMYHHVIVCQYLYRNRYILMILAICCAEWEVPDMIYESIFICIHCIFINSWL